MTDRTAAAPSDAVRAWYPSAVSASSSILRTSALSSTTRTRPVGAPACAAGFETTGAGGGAGLGGGGPASAATRAAADTGLVNPPARPAAVAWRWSSGSMLPVTTRTRMPGLYERIRLRASTPPRRGIIRSSTTASGCSRLTYRRASSPFAAATTSKPDSRKDSTSSSRTSRSSSTISTRMRRPSPLAGRRARSQPERVEASDVAADDQRVDVVRALVRVDRLQIHHVPDDRVLVHDAGRAQDVARQSGAVERHLHVVHLRHRHLLRAQLAGVLEAAELQAQELGLGDLGNHPDELLLHELERPDRLAELDALLGVLQGPVVARHRRAHRAPGDPVAGLVETAERAAQPLHLGKLVLQRNPAILEG